MGIFAYVWTQIKGGYIQEQAHVFSDKCSCCNKTTQVGIFIGVFDNHVMGPGRWSCSVMVALYDGLVLSGLSPCHVFFHVIKQLWAPSNTCE